MKKKHIIWIVIAAVVLVAEPYRMQRLTSFLDPWHDPYGSGYQLIQSLIAFGRVSIGLRGTVNAGDARHQLKYEPVSEHGRPGKRSFWPKPGPAFDL